MRTRLGKRRIEDMAEVYSGPTSTRPSPGMRGRYYFCTDTLKWCRDTGTAWQEVGGGGGGTPSDSVTYETTHGQSPAAGSATAYSRGDHAHGSPEDPVPAHAALPGAHHAAFIQADHDALPNPHHAQAHTLTSHSTRAHSELTDIGPDDHHPQAHNQDASTITTGTLDGDRLPAMSAAKKGGVPATGAPSGKYLKDDGTWAAPAGGGESEVVVIKGSDTANATTTLADAVGLTFVGDANSLYIIEVFLLWNASAVTVGIKVSASATGSPTINAGHFIAEAANGTPDGSAWNANDIVVTTSASPFTANCLGTVQAILKTGASTSTWVLRFAAETTGTITIKANSVLRYRKVA